MTLLPSHIMVFTSLLGAHYIGFKMPAPFLSSAVERDYLCKNMLWSSIRPWILENDSCLKPDLETLPNGGMSEMGERMNLDVVRTFRIRIPGWSFSLI